MPRKHNTIPEVAYMHEGTVQDIADGTIKPVKKIRTRADSNPTPHVGHIRVDPRVWETVMKLSAGIKDRIEIHSSISVTVHNNGEWRKNAESRNNDEVDEGSDIRPGE